MNRPDLSVEYTPALEEAQQPPAKARWVSALLGDFTWTLFGNGVFAACQWGIIIALAKLLTAVAVGQYSLGQAILAPTLMFAAFQLRAVIASDLKGQFTTREYFGFRLITLTAGLLLAILIGFATTRSVLQTEIVAVIGLIQFCEQTSDTLYGFLQRRGNLVRPALSMIIKGPVGLLALTLTLYWTRGILAGLIALLITRIALLSFYDLRGALKDSVSALNGISGYFAWRRHFQLFKVVFFVGLMTMLIALVGMIPRYFVEYYCGQRELGVYGALSSLISIGLLPVGALGLAAFVPLARAFASGLSHEFMKILGLLVSLSFGIGISGVTVAYFGGHQVLSLLFRPEYGEYAYLFVWIMIVGAVLFITASLGASLTAARIYRPQVALLTVVAITETIGCWVLTPRFGLMGAVWSCLGAGIVQFAGTAVILYMRFPRQALPVLATADISN